jgi:hypothetical protein
VREEHLTRQSLNAFCGFRYKNGMKVTKSPATT